MIASYLFGGILLTFMMAIVAYNLIGEAREISGTTQKLIGFLCALLAGLFAFFFTGTISAQVAPNAGTYGSLGIQATGGAALFVVMLWWWRSDAAPLRAADKNALDALARALSYLDSIYPALAAVTRGQAEKPSNYSLVASKEGDEIAFRRTGDRKEPPVMVITASDIEKLPKEERDHIRTREASMQQLVKKWEELYPKRMSGTVDDQQKKGEELKELAREICRGLDGILNHLGILGKRLEDHYAAARSICYELDQGRRM